MKDAQKRSDPERTRAARSARLLLPAAAACALCAVFFAAPEFGATGTPVGTGGVPFLLASSAAAQGAANFSHSTQGHASRSCASCHDRAGSAPQPRLPGHKACDDCHVQQFVTVNAPFCGLCHTDIGSRNPPVKAFPSLRSFNAKFSHAAHETGSGRPQAGCASCHAPISRGVALSIPAGIPAHANCYQCHTQGASAAGLSSCDACHSLGRYSRTPTGSRAYRLSFSHADHDARRGMNCADCHTVRAGAAQGRQVTSPVPTQHFGSSRAQNCMTCHNNRRAFGGDDFADCKRCHKGTTFRL